MDICPDGYYSSNFDNQCHLCHTDCLTCDGSDKTDCLVCKNNKVKDIDDICVSDC